jgi:hypothetical protein
MAGREPVYEKIERLVSTLFALEGIRESTP